MIAEEGLMDDLHDDGSRAIETVEDGTIMTFTMTTRVKSSSMRNLLIGYLSGISFWDF